MTQFTKQIVDMMDMLPIKEQAFAYEVMCKLVLAWDPDFTKLTSKESDDLEIAKKQFEDGEYYNFDEIDWDNLDSLQ
jgi:hypothetical protein